MRGLLFIAYFLTCSCNAQDHNIKITINNKNNYYFDKEKLMAVVSSKKDSVSFTYRDSLILKIEKHKTGRLISYVNFVYDVNNNISDNFIFPEDYYDYFEKFYARVLYTNKYKLLDRDFVYIDAVLDQEKKKYYSKETKIFEFNLDKNVRMLNAKFSPFAYGTILKKIKLYVVNNFLVELDAMLVEEPNGEIIYYKKHYEYDKEGRLSSSKTINVISGEIEDQDKIEYKAW
ncbi:hypothetical protein BXU01_13235 [[Flexibacter] sp. ATCC 35103]|nr:hypothetical protein BXU01_13235 [[Flexibacter] sp. ATCC 35103]